MSACLYTSGSDSLVSVSQDANPGISSRLVLDEGAERAVADQPELPPLETTERVEQHVDPLSLDEASDEEIARLTRHEEARAFQWRVRPQRGERRDHRAVRVRAQPDGVAGMSRAAGEPRIRWT